MLNIEEWLQLSNIKLAKMIIKELFICLGNDILELKPIVKEFVLNILFFILNILLILLFPIVFIYTRYFISCMKIQKNFQSSVESNYILTYNKTYVDTYNKQYYLDRLLLPYVEWIHKKSLKNFINIVNYTPKKFYGYIIPFFKVCYWLIVGRYRRLYNKYVVKKEIKKIEK